MKTYINKRIAIILTVTIIIGFSSCKKEDDFLNKKPNAALAVPTPLSDFQLILNNETLFNGYNGPGLNILSCDDMYVTDAAFNADGEPYEENTYIFAKDIYQGQTGAAYADWSAPYQQIYYCNVVLDGLKKINPTSTQLTEYNTIKGEALFFRAYAFYNLAQEFTMPYDQAQSATDPGIPLVISSDINKRYTRGTVQETYNQIISDINGASQLLPASLTSVTKPCRLSCIAFLARVNLAMRNYTQAYTNANAVLSQDSVLVDYNTITPRRNALSATILAEDIYHSAMSNPSLAFVAQMDSTLYGSYDATDLRKNYFFRPLPGIGLRFRGTYDIHNNLYTGLATDEMYLIRAECNARSGNVPAGLNDLNRLLSNRYTTGQFIPLKISSQDSLLQRVLLEREKELYFRGLRWTDLRRLNKEAGFAKTVTHVINGVTYKLPPNDPRYAFPIPDQEVQLTGIPQNPR